MNKKGGVPEIVIDIFVWILLIMFGIGFYLLFIYEVDQETETIQSRMMAGSFQPMLHFLNAPHENGMRNKEFISNVLSVS